MFVRHCLIFITDSLFPIFIFTLLLKTIGSSFGFPADCFFSVQSYTLIFIARWHPENFNICGTKLYFIHQLIHTFNFVCWNTEFNPDQFPDFPLKPFPGNHNSNSLPAGGSLPLMDFCCHLPGCPSLTFEKSCHLKKGFVLIICMKELYFQALWVAEVF